MKLFACKSSKKYFYALFGSFILTALYSVSLKIRVLNSLIMINRLFEILLPQIRINNEHICLMQ